MLAARPRRRRSSERPLHGSADWLVAGLERAQHDDALGLAVLAADQVAAVRWSEGPRELQLDEDEQLLGHRRTVSFR
jgi:hypothetical protein